VGDPKKADPTYPTIVVHAEGVMPKNAAELGILHEQIEKVRYGTGAKASDVKATLGPLGKTIEFSFLV
jgi:hypothetical protein